MTSVENALDLQNVIPQIRGVLFDIDDTLIDLRSAAINGFLAMTETQLGHLDQLTHRHIAEDFADDGAGAYERYMTGELSFLGQRYVRLERAFKLANVSAPSGHAYEVWAAEYEELVRVAWAPFSDVDSLLAQLETNSIPFGAVSNNVESYQREKLVRSGLVSFQVVIGSDTAGAPKPSPAPFLEGCRQLGTSPEATLYVGDNPVNDVQGAQDAGMPAVLLDRLSKCQDHLGLRIVSLDELTIHFGETGGLKTLGDATISDLF